MNKIIIAIAAAVGMLLASCSQSSIEKAQEVAALVKKNCGIAVSVSSVVAAFLAPNPVITGVTAMANAICQQAKRTETGEADDDASVPVEYEPVVLVPVGDVQPLPDPKPPVVEPDVDPEEVPPEGTDEQEEEVECVAVINGVCIEKETK